MQEDHRIAIIHRTTAASDAKRLGSKHTHAPAAAAALKDRCRAAIAPAVAVLNKLQPKLKAATLGILSAMSIWNRVPNSVQL